jgi:organic radical activating enzyme
MSNILTYWDDIQRLARGVMVAPTFATMQTCDACNQHCLGCAYRKYHKGKMLTKQEHFRVVDILIAEGVKAFEFCGGGEPTLLPYLPELLKYISDLDCFSGILTNGAMLGHPALARAILANCGFVRISMEASSREMYAKYKRVLPVKWDWLLQDISSLVELRNKTHYRCQISLKFSVSKTLRGDSHYYDMIKLSDRLQVDRMYVKALRHEPEEISLPDRILERAKYQQALWYSPIIPGRIEKHEAIVLNDPVPQCWLNPLHVVVDHLGNCYLCCYYYFRQRRHCLGNMLKENFRKFWYSSEHRRKIEAIKADECAKIDCKFFAHHAAVKEAMTRGRGYWL